MREVISLCIFSLLVSYPTQAGLKVKSVGKTMPSPDTGAPAGGFGGGMGGMYPGPGMGMGMGFGGTPDPNMPKDFFNLSNEIMNHKDFPKVDWSNGFNGVGPNPEEKDESVISSYDKGVRGLIDKLPDSTVKDGLQHYLDIINSKSYGGDGGVGGSNSGIVAFNQNTLSENTCFSQLAEAMYKDIHNQDQELQKKTYDRNDPLYGRPSLAKEAGKEPYQDLKPGWLMDKAMEYAGGDANLAFRLLGVCGHDDTAQGALGYKLTGKEKMSASPEEYLDVLNYQIKLQQKMIKNMDDQYQEYTKDPEAYMKKNYSQFGTDFSPYPEGYNHEESLSGLKTHLKNLQSFKTKVESDEVSLGKTTDIKRRINCPRQKSTMYLSKSLGKDADLSDDFKEKVAGIQAPTKGKGVIPSKNYHIMAGAFMSCQLISKGYSPKLAATVQEMAAWAYRTVRINNTVKRDLKTYEKIEELYNKFKEEFKKENSEIVLTPRGQRSILKKSPPSMIDWAFNNKNSSDLDMYLPYFDSKEQLKKSIAKFDAAKVIDDMTFGGGEIFGQSIPHTNLTLDFLGDPIQQHINERKRREMQGNKKRRGSGRTKFGWDTDRYNRAKEKAMTYLVDWDWTTEQHKTGAKFAADKCKKKPLDYKPDDTACKVFGDKPGITCDIDYYSEYQAENSNLGGVMIHGSKASVSKLAVDLEKVKDKVQEKYLDPELEFEITDDGASVKGLY